MTSSFILSVLWSNMFEKVSLVDRSLLVREDRPRRSVCNTSMKYIDEYNWAYRSREVLARRERPRKVWVDRDHVVRTDVFDDESVRQVGDDGEMTSRKIFYYSSLKMWSEWIRKNKSLEWSSKEEEDETSNKTGKKRRNLEAFFFLFSEPGGLNLVMVVVAAVSLWRQRIKKNKIGDAKNEKICLTYMQRDLPGRFLCWLW